MQMTINDIADYFNVSRRTVYRWLEKKIIPAYKVNDQYRFVYNEIVEWARSNRIESSNAATISEADIQVQEPAYPLYSAIMSGGVYYRVEGDSIESVLRNVIDMIKLPHDFNKEQLYLALIEREIAASTGIGGGLAIPHPRNPSNLKLSVPMLNICFLEKPLDFNALDGRPVNCLLILVSPDSRFQMKLMSRLGFVLKNRDFVKLLEECGSREKICGTIKAAEAALKKQKNRI